MSEFKFCPNPGFNLALNNLGPLSLKAQEPFGLEGKILKSKLVE